MGAALNTDHVNYVIWRYLQEQGYGRTAVQLQRDWHNNDPQSLPFTDNVEHHTLIRMLQDALAYDLLIGEASKTQDHGVDEGFNGENPAPQQEQHLGKRWTFVDVTQRRQVARQTESRRVSAGDHAELKRKRQRRETAEGQRPPAGRRKSLKGADQAAETSGDAMDVDGEGDHDDEDMQEMAEEAPVKEEPPPPPPPHTLEIGTSIGIQSDPIVDKIIARTIAKTSIPNAEILRVSWNAPDSLVVSGGSVCHTIKVTPKSARHVTEEHNVEEEVLYDLIAEPALSDMKDTVGYSIGQWERAPSGEQVAAAIEQLYQNGEMNGTLSILQDGKLVYLADTPNVVLALKWDSSSTKLLAIWDSADREQSFINIWDATNAQPTGRIVSSKHVHDATWLTDGSFACCGENLLDLYAVESETIKHTKSIETNHPWEQLKHDYSADKIVCTSANEGELGLLDTNEHTLQIKNAHEDIITSFEWQRGRADKEGSTDDQSRMLATSCTDGSVKLWDARQALECVHSFAAGPMMPAWNLEFAPDGSKLAAIIGDEVRVWEAKVNGMLLAKWKEGVEKAQEERRNGERQGGQEMDLPNSIDNSGAEDMSPMYSLAWDDAARRLAVTHGSSISIVEMPDIAEGAVQVPADTTEHDREMT